ncbi:MAG: anaerobic ribonucleoside-triphosphate reductase activating protein [Candidatus Pacebacteria bacterium]|nr:anaerobic ribonucleoside-triphosphate reductase activating protein [Candidatus Paceibacterota bacterium]
MRLGGLQKTSLIDYPGKMCAIVFTIGCNFHCPYCHNPELVDETAEEISEEDFFTFLKSRVGLLDAVTITGGEPTLHDDLLLFIHRIKQMGFLVKLDSNGTNPGTLRKLIDAKLVDYIAMDIKSPLQKYSETVARPVDIVHIKESIDLLREGKVGYEFRTTVVKVLLSSDDFHEIGELIRGSDLYYLQKFVPTKILNPAFHKKATYTDEEFEELRKVMENYVKVCQIR